MAFLTLNYHSDALRRGVSVNVILPENHKTAIGMSSHRDNTYKTLYLLHGLSDDQTIWSRRTSIERYAARYGISVVMPCTDRAWYSNTYYGAKYFTFISKELPTVCRSFFAGMSPLPEDNFIAGNSMGGYGAMKVALTFPEAFGGCASLSGALDLTGKTWTRVSDPKEWKNVFGEVFASSDEVIGSENDVYYLAKNAANAATLPKLYMWCGAEDALLEANREVHQQSSCRTLRLWELDLHFFICETETALLELM